LERHREVTPAQHHHRTGQHRHADQPDQAVEKHRHQGLTPLLRLAHDVVGLHHVAPRETQHKIAEEEADEGESENPQA